MQWTLATWCLPRQIHWTILQRNKKFNHWEIMNTVHIGIRKWKSKIGMYDCYDKSQRL